MTQVGHCLFGATLAVLTTPPDASRRQWTWRTGLLMALANVPDLPLPGWGHQRYDISHSLFVNLALIAAMVVALGASPGVRAGVGGWPLLAAGAGACLSHLLLDTLYGNNLGLAMFWPLSDARLSLPIPLFATTRYEQPASSPANVRVYLVELAAYLALLVLALATRRIWLRGRRRQTRVEADNA